MRVGRDEVLTPSFTLLQLPFRLALHRRAGRKDEVFETLILARLIPIVPLHLILLIFRDNLPCVLCFYPTPAAAALPPCPAPPRGTVGQGAGDPGSLRLLLLLSIPPPSTTLCPIFGAITSRSLNNGSRNSRKDDILDRNRGRCMGRGRRRCNSRSTGRRRSRWGRSKSREGGRLGGKRHCGGIAADGVPPRAAQLLAGSHLRPSEPLWSDPGAPGGWQGG